MAQFIPAPSTLATALLAQLAVVAILFLLRRVGIDIYQNLVTSIKWFTLTLRAAGGEETIFVYTDADDAGETTSTLANAIRQHCTGNGSQVRVEEVDTGDEFDELPISPQYTKAVVIFLMDVLPLSSNADRRRRIQEKIIAYCRNGGTVILGHDTLYRRSKNELFQHFAGCRLVDFTLTDDPVPYVRVDDGSERATDADDLLEALPERMALNDREFVTGEWHDNVEFLYVHGDDPTVPLVTRRTIGEGTVYWVNSGDYNEMGPPQSIAGPDEALVRCVGAFIEAA